MRRELVAKMAQTAPIARRRAEDLRQLVEQNFVSHHGYLDREQQRIEHERDLAYQQSRVLELEEAVREAQRRKEAYVAEVRRSAIDAATAAEKRAAALAKERTKAERKGELTQLTAPVDGTVQQLAVHTSGGVVSAAQLLLD